MLPSKLEKDTGSRHYVIPTISKSVVNGNIAVVVANISTDSVYKSIRKNTIPPSTDFMVLDSDNRIIVYSIE